MISKQGQIYLNEYLQLYKNSCIAKKHYDIDFSVKCRAEDMVNEYKRNVKALDKLR